MSEREPGVGAALERLVEPDTRGDPDVAAAVDVEVDPDAGRGACARQGTGSAARTVAELLHEAGLQPAGHRQDRRGRQHPDRDAQFGYLNEQVNAHLGSGDPVISGGHQEEGTGRPVQQRRPGVAAHGEPGAGRRARLHRRRPGKAIPYGVYDLAANAGWVSVGTDHDTAAFAVATIAPLVGGGGPAAYPHARRLLITADAGGSNGYRTRLWKVELAALAARNRPGDHRLPPTARHLQVEQDRAPAVLATSP